MGWFSDEEIFHASITTVQMFEEEVDPILNAVAAAIFTDGDQHNYVMAAHYNSLTLLLNRYLRYAKDPERFPPGLPTSKVRALAVADEIVLPILEGIVGEPIVIHLARAGTKEPAITVFVFLQDNYGWNEFDNIATIAGTDYEYVDYEAETETYTYYNSELEQWVEEERATGNLLLNFTKKAGGDPYQEVFVFGLFHEDLWLHVQYTIVSEDQGTKFKPYYWMYNSSQDDTYPELSEENLTATVEIDSEYYPVITLMREGDFVPSLIEDPDDPNLEIPNPEFEAADGLLRKLYFGMQDFIDALSGEDLPEDEEKPDLSKVDDIAFLFAVNVYTEVEASIEYLWHYFHMLAEYSIVTYTDYEASLEKIQLGALPETNYLAISEGDFNVTLMYNYMTVTKNIVITDEELVSKYTKDIIILDRYTWKWEDGRMISTVTTDTSYVRIRKKTSSTTYDEITLNGPVMRTKVRALGESKYIYRHLVEEGAEDTKTGDPRHGFFFPVSFTIADNLTIIHKDIMVYDAMMLVIYAADIEVIKWYQKGIFKILLTIIVVVITVILTLAFGPGALTFYNVVVNSLISLATAFVVSIALDLLIQLVGGKLATIIAVIAIIVKLYLGDWTAFADLPWAEQLLQATQAIVQVANVYTQVAGLSLQYEMEEFIESAKERQEEIDAANDFLLEDDSAIDPLYIQREVAMISGYEDPADFYERTIHMGNPGVRSLDAIEEYVGNKLRLPDFDPSQQFTPA